MSLESITLTRTALASLTASFTGRLPNPEDPEIPPHTPWGPIIRRAIIGKLAPGDPIPWHRAPGEQAGINPQPLPPRWALVQAIGAAVREHLESGIIFVGGAVGREAEPRALGLAKTQLTAFVDDFCGNGVIARFLPHPPRPILNDETQLGADLVVLGVALGQQAQDTTATGLRELLAGAAASVLAQAAGRLNRSH